MYSVQASTLSEEFIQLRNRFPPDPDSIESDDIVTITNMSPIDPPVNNFELLTLLMHVDVDCYQTIILDDELYQFGIREKNHLNYSVCDDRVPDGLIYCARYDKVVRGYNLRPHNKKCTNSLMIQSYYSGRNVNIKISADNILFCGPVCEEDCHNILEMTTFRLNQVLSDIIYIREHEEDIRSFMKLCPPQSFKKGEFRAYIRDEWVESVEDERLREIILRVGMGARSTSVIITRLRSIFFLIKQANLPPRVDNDGLNIVMMKASYKLPYSFPFIEFHAYLGTLPGLKHTVAYHPDVLQKMKLFILRYDNNYADAIESREDITTDHTYELDELSNCESGCDEDTNSSILTIEEVPWSQIETISIASTFTVNQVSFNTQMLRETRSMFMAILEDFITNHVSSYAEL